ncbi:MAG: hypothetical protein CL508_05250 [Actinobacteria bacterium]|nr:hypothetical protein [Actinomycetota bacterium]MBO71704.1 hypothetical protein [Actinomycetota bacterium]|tara:strand:+ start:26816 stop:28546 length:1731 start_codon:yes stop_codon:yes gene_type:complete
MSLFKTRSKARKLPNSLPNLALQGNKVRVYSYEEGKTNPSDRHGIPIPKSSYKSDHDTNRAVLLQTLRKKYFYLKKYRGDIDWDLMAIAETLCVLPVANKVIEKRIQSASKYTDKYDSEEGYKGSTARYYNVGKLLPEMNTASKKYYIDNLVDELYTRLKNSDDLEVILESLSNDTIKTFGFVQADSQFGVDSNELDYVIKSAIQRHLPSLLLIDEEKVSEELYIIKNLLQRCMWKLSHALDIVNRNKVKYKWVYDSQEEGFRRRRILYKPTNYSRRVYNALHTSNYYYGVRGMVDNIMRLPSIKENAFGNNQVYIDTDSLNPVDDDKELDDIPQMMLPKYLSESLQDSITKEAEQNFRGAKHRVNYRTDGGGVHGKARHRRFKGTKPIIEALKKLAVSQGEYGVKPRQVHRIITDRKVFKRRKHIAGGSLMIDCSGSMGFYNEDIKEIVNTLPASTIAGYVGYGHSIGGHDGDIRIIAQKGRLDESAIDNLTEYGANSIDLEALKWLAKQEEPRIWVSDMQVIGVDGAEEHRPSLTLSTERIHAILRFMAINNIIPIEDIKHVKEFAKQYAKFIG